MSEPDGKIKGWDCFGTAGLIRKMFERMLEARDVEKHSVAWDTLMQDVMAIQWELGRARTEPSETRSCP